MVSKRNGALAVSAQRASPSEGRRRAVITSHRCAEIEVAWLTRFGAPYMGGKEIRRAPSTACRRMTRSKRVQVIDGAATAETFHSPGGFYRSATRAR
jgi:hypothetical protein